ncbi:MAG: hypothetical protein RLY35_2131 [Bacteroidota bacterium]|jgi:membrane-associated protein
MRELLDILLHINDHLDAWLQLYGTSLYFILFLIIFVETGLVIMPFLPGDSLLFAVGAICARMADDPNPAISLFPLIALLSVAAIAGDHSNYFIGKYAGAKVVRWKIGGKALVKESYITKTQAFFDQYGTKAIVLARFVPIVRTFTPFVAGVGNMEFKKKFMPYDIMGGVLWISSMTIAGYILGSHEWVKAHFEAVVLIIIFLSILPMILAYIKHLIGKKK